MASNRRGEVWLVDLGYAAKTRPVLVVSVPPADSERALIALVPHTASTRGTRYEVATSESYLKEGAFDVQSLVTVREAKMLRRLVKLAPGRFEEVMNAVLSWLGVKR